MTSNDVLFLTGVGTGLFLVFVGVTIWCWEKLRRVSNQVDSLEVHLQAEISEVNQVLQTEVNELNRRITNIHDEINSELREQLDNLNLRITSTELQFSNEIKEIVYTVDKYLKEPEDK